MSISLTKFEEMQQALLEQQAFLLLVQFSRRWCSENTPSNRASLLYSIALMELCCPDEADSVLQENTDIDALSVRVDIALRCEDWTRATHYIEELRSRESNHPRLSEYLSLVRVARNHDPHRLIRSSIFEQRLKAIEIMMYKGSRQQARVYLEHWKKDRPENQRIHDLHCAAKGDLEFHGDWDELLQEVFERTHEDECTQKISRQFEDVEETEQISLEDCSEETDNQSQVITDNLADTTQTEDFGPLIEISHHSYTSEDSLSLSEVVLNHENIVLTSNECADPIILLQKTAERHIESRPKARNVSNRFTSWIILIGMILGISVGFGFWMIERAKTLLHSTVEEVILSADIQALIQRRQILRHQYQNSSFIKEERKNSIHLLCAVIWYDFTRAEEDKKCAEGGSGREGLIAETLISLGERDYTAATEHGRNLDDSDLVSLWVQREILSIHTEVEASQLPHVRFRLQDMKGGHDIELSEGVLPWIDLEILERDWTSYSRTDKQEKLDRLRKAHLSNQLGRQKQARMLLLYSIFEMEQENFRKAKYYRMQALERDPHNIQLRYWLGWDYYEEGDLYKASESWTVCEMIQVECSMAQIMVLIDLDQLERVSDLIEEVHLLQSRQSLLNKWLEWAQRDIPDSHHPIFEDLLYDHERWRGVFKKAENEQRSYREKKLNLSDLSWRGLFMVGLETFEKKPSKASKILSMSIELLRSTESSSSSRPYGVTPKRPKHEAVSHYRILGWMKKRNNEPTVDLWRLYLQKGPTGYAAEKVEREMK